MPTNELLDVLLDAWKRNNTILLGLLSIIPEGGMQVRAGGGGHSVAEIFSHIHYVRLAFVQEDAPECARELPASTMEDEWSAEHDVERLTSMLNSSAGAVRDAVKTRVEAGRGMAVHFDHPVLMLQHLIWHEGYHHGQIKLALKLAGMPIPNEEAGPVTWRVWMNKTV